MVAASRRAPLVRSLIHLAGGAPLMSTDGCNRACGVASSGAATSNAPAWSGAPPKGGTMTHLSDLGYCPTDIRPDGRLSPRWLSPASVRLGQQYPGQFGYVGQHRVDEGYGRGRVGQPQHGRHLAWAMAEVREVMDQVTVDELLRRHRGWPFALLDNRRYMPTPAANMLPGMPLDAS